MTILEALKKLDPANASHWTSDGLPKVDIVSSLVSDKVTREDIAEIAPEFIRDGQVLPKDSASVMVEIQEKIDAVSIELGILNMKKDKLVADLDVAIQAHEDEHKDKNGVMSFLAAQKKLQAAEGKKREVLAEKLGLTLKEFNNLTARKVR